jgi:hypothetical protein
MRLREGPREPSPRYDKWPRDQQDAWYAQAEARAAHDEPKRGNGAGEPAAGAPCIIKATPFVWRDPAKIPPRRWLYGSHYIRQFITATVSGGGVGKSSLEIVEALAMVTGRALLDITPNERVNVWYWNGEDPEDELERRVVAACLHYEIDPSEIEGRLFVDTGRKVKIIIAEQTRAGATIARPVVDAVIATIKENKLGVMTVDPFVASHRITENDNGAIELVASAWAEIADVTGCDIELVHHTRKTGGAEITTEDGRGGSALLAKARSGRGDQPNVGKRGRPGWRRMPPQLLPRRQGQSQHGASLRSGRLVSPRFGRPAQRRQRRRRHQVDVARPLRRRDRLRLAEGPGRGCRRPLARERPSEGLGRLPYRESLKPGRNRQ